MSYFKSVRKLADEHNLKVHLDGARILNASIAAGVEPSEFTSLVDSVNMCFSKVKICHLSCVKKEYFALLSLSTP